MNILHLEVNDSGGWRRVMSFEGASGDRADLEYHAHNLLMMANNARIKARIIAPGTTAPVMTWTAADGWKEWRA